VRQLDLGVLGALGLGEPLLQQLVLDHNELGKGDSIIIILTLVDVQNMHLKIKLWLLVDGCSIVLFRAFYCLYSMVNSIHHRTIYKKKIAY
jgi:hypothetical protein